MLGLSGDIAYRFHTASARSQELKPNYQYEKRQRELEKKKKKAEKELRKTVPPTPSQTTEPETSAEQKPAD